GDAVDAERPKPSAHLTGRLGGERDCHHASRRVRAGVDAVRDAMRDHARLAGPGACEDHDRSPQGGDRLELLPVEAEERPVAHSPLAYQSLIRRYAIEAGPGRSTSLV